MAAHGNESGDQDEVESVWSSDEQDFPHNPGSDVVSDDDVSRTQHGERCSSANTSAADQAAKAIEAAQETASIAGTSRPPSLAPSLAASSFWYHPPRQQRRNSSPAPPEYAEAIAQFPYLPHAHSPAFVHGTTINSSNNLTKSHPWTRWFRRYWKWLTLFHLIFYCVVMTAVLAFQWAMADEEMLSIRSKPSWSSAEGFHANTNECTFNESAAFKYFAWRSPGNFSFTERMHPRKDAFIRISGRVEIQPAPERQHSSIEVIASAATSSTWTAGSPQFEYDADGLHVILAQFALPPSNGVEHGDLKRRASGSMQCLDLFVGIYVKDMPKHWSIETETMDVTIGRSSAFKGFQMSELRVDGETRILSQRGSIDVLRLDSQGAYISSQHGQVSGSFALREQLHLRTLTGDISVDVARQTSHQIQGQPAANFTTTTHSGNQHVTLTQPQRGRVWRESSYEHTYTIQSRHSSSSGAIEVQSNGFWEGELTATTATGQITLHESSMEALGDPQSNPIRMRKGTEDSCMLVDTWSGDVRVSFDDTMKR